VYWDSSAVLSVLFRDRHTEDAVAWARRPGVHLLSSVAWAEVHAVIARIARERALAEALLGVARNELTTGPWRRTSIVPEWGLVQALSSGRPLRGADLWHLAAAKTLRAELPELTLLTYDDRLAAAAREEGLAS
jgi:predicted nucleic acid-binding protein